MALFAIKTVAVSRKCVSYDGVASPLPELQMSVLVIPTDLAQDRNGQA